MHADTSLTTAPPVMDAKAEVSDAVRAQLALRAGKMASFDWHMDTGIVESEAKLRELYGMPLVGQQTVDDFFAIIHPEDIPHVDAAITRAIEQDVDYQAEWRVIHPDGKIRWLGGQGRITARDADGTPQRMLGLNWDITDRKAQEEQLALMAREMNHRVKNIFAMIAALIRMAKSRTHDVASFADVLRSQVFALSDAHALTMEYSSSQGTAQAIPARRIVEAAVAAWNREGGVTEIVIDVSDQVTLDARQTSALAMMLYELATNAAKYGALAQDGGTLDISLLREPGDRARLIWREVLANRTLDPGAIAAAQDGGFGSVLLRQSALALDGSLQQDTRLQGVEVTLDFPI
ncbi:sensor histidine kinase [Pontivivens insulae]|uniref:histidine kinase n=1 Tax=Pontivivens insulae TaxID=1639689 RepID=A0A2R8AAM0_9RHOB|nr:sensor histidine kinase [Pontivivens insulae]RED13195.1 PAS domain S-box-containing protein [Pontivivens insulae]SPF29287.1 Blue-light-activated histidine kinase 1 [Pontivivens insulae]